MRNQFNLHKFDPWLQNSIENLEYEFATAIHKVIKEKSKKIAILKGNGQPADTYLFSFLKKVGSYYRLAEFTLDSIENNPVKTLDDLSSYDLAIITKPSEAFSEKEKFALDNFDQLSMGMSGDYCLAIEEGATMVRVGTSIFGEEIND